MIHMLFKRNKTLALRILSLFSVCICAFMQYGCVTNQKVRPAIIWTVQLNFKQQQPTNVFTDLDYGLKLNIIDQRTDKPILNQYPSLFNIQKPIVTTFPDIQSFVSETMTQHMRLLGFGLNADFNTDYMLQIEITQYELNVINGVWGGVISFNIQLSDNNNNVVYRQTVTGRASAARYTMARALNEAYANAMENMDWSRIASFLKRAETPISEKNKQVTGEGDTALEHTIIRWYIDSAPKGADVFWRVVSSTPDVKNTNQLYLGTTPYESTESFDIKGLTFNNSGDVQIEISCEKIGYSTQRKRFNVRQAIEQKEISTKFNLIEE